MFIILSKEKSQAPKSKKRKKVQKKVRWKTTKTDKKSERERHPALADDEVLLDRLPIAEEESREGDSGEPPAIALAKKAHPPTFPLREERRKSWWQASALGRTLNSEGRIEGDSKTTKSANKRALHPALSVAKRKVFAVVGGQAVSGFV